MSMLLRARQLAVLARVRASRCDRAERALAASRRVEADALRVLEEASEQAAVADRRVRDHARWFAGGGEAGLIERGLRLGERLTRDHGERRQEEVEAEQARAAAARQVEADRAELRRALARRDGSLRSLGDVRATLAGRVDRRAEADAEDLPLGKWPA